MRIAFILNLWYPILNGLLILLMREFITIADGENENNNNNYNKQTEVN